MRLILLLLVFVAPCVAAQQKFFEGNIIYKVSVKAASGHINDADAAKILAASDTMNIFIKNGNYRLHNQCADVYTIAKDKKAYYKFRKIDTLYYLDLTVDTAHIVEIIKKDSLFRFNNYPCRAITIKNTRGTSTWYYTDSLLNNPEYDKEHIHDSYNVYAQETHGGLYLWNQQTFSIGTQTAACIQVQQKSIDDQVFNLPLLPLKEISKASLFIPARFSSKEDNGNAWIKYLQGNLNQTLGNKYIKLNKGEKEGSQTVIVDFVINSNGKISNIQVANKTEVHPRLAEEAIRVIQESHNWQPAVIYGEKVASGFHQPITFMAIK